MKKKNKQNKNIKNIRKFINANPAYVLIVGFIVIMLLYEATTMIKNSVKDIQVDYSETKYELNTIMIGDKEILPDSASTNFYTDASFSINDISLDYEGYISHVIYNQDFELGNDIVFEPGDKVYIYLYRYDEKIDSYIVEVEPFLEYDKWSEMCPLSLLRGLKEETEEYCSKNIKIDNENYLLEASFNGKQNIDGAGWLDYGFNIKLNNILIYSGYLGDFFYLNEYYVIEDAIFFAAHRGTDIGGNYIIGVLPESRVFLNLENPDQELEYVYIYTYDNPIEVEGNKISFLGTRATHAEFILGTNEKRICDVNSKDIITATYSFNYLGNGSISSITRSNIQTAEQIIKDYENSGYDVCPN
jgi:hypothetical protein